MTISYFCQDGTEVTQFKWAPNEPNAMNSNENKLMLLQGLDFLWNDGREDSHSEYEQTNKALCECKCILSNASFQILRYKFANSYLMLL